MTTAATQRLTELVTQLFGTGKFSLVERSQLEARCWLSRTSGKAAGSSEQAAEIGRILGVQMILTGSITKFSVDTKGGGFGRFRAEYSEAESNLDIRLINTDTARDHVCRLAGEGKVRLGGLQVKGMNFRQEFDAGLAQEALRPAVEDVAAEDRQSGWCLSLRSSDRRHRLRSLERNGGSFYIAQGRESRHPGRPTLRGPPCD